MPTNPSSPSHLHPTAGWVLACHNEDGGFGSFPGDISAPRPTAWAIDALDALGADPLAPDRAAHFLCSLQGEDGGFHGRPWGLRWTDKSTLADSYHVVRALHALGRPAPRRDDLLAFVRSRQRSDGAFLQDLYPETAGVCAETFYAVSILRALEAEVPQRDRVVAFLGRMQQCNVRRDGGFIVQDAPSWRPLVEAAHGRAGSLARHQDPGPDDTHAIPVAVGYTDATCDALSALSLLGERAPDPAAAASFLRRRQHRSGGFVSGMGRYGAYRDPSEGRMSDTYSALSALRLLAAGAIDADRAAAWIGACQNPDGGFCRRPDPASRPSDMAATAQAVRSLALLGRPVPSPARWQSPARERLPDGIEFLPTSPFFQPDQPGQALYLHRIVAPIVAADETKEAAAIELMRWQNCLLTFCENSRNEAALIIEDGYGVCGPQARCLAGLLEAAGIPARFLMVEGHCTCEGYLGGRWCLLDAEFQGAFGRPDGLLCSALDVHEAHRRGEPEITTFGDWRYQSYTIHQPRGDGWYHEFAIEAGDTAESASARSAYPETASRPRPPAAASG
ncbi:MAG: prenyltransferase/squalene oxidase repeat-containing protein [Planctomycetota bacterium]|jgi:hypothetical protein